MSINNIFEQLAAESGRNAKIAILNKNKGNAVLKEVCRLALDPFTQFYIRKIPDYKTFKRPELTLAQGLADISKNLATRKITGNAGIAFLRSVLERLDADDAKVLVRVIEKDLRCGASEATINAVWAGLVHEYPCMLASAYDQKLVDKVKFPAFVQLKADGMRFNAIVKNGSVDFRTRNGKQIHIADPTFEDHFIKMANGDSVVFDGELICKSESGDVLDRKTGNGILNKAVKQTQSVKEGQSVCAVLWDMIPYANFQVGICNIPYDSRFKALQKVITLASRTRVECIPSKIVDSLDDARACFEEYLSAGQEGIILKTRDMVWEDKRSKSQIKFKGEFECDLKVVEWQEGTGKHVGRLGALICESADGKVRVGVGTGFTDANRDAITPKIVGKIVAVKYNARINDKRSDVDSLFLPVFVEVRLDKTKADHSRSIK